MSRYRSRAWWLTHPALLVMLLAQVGCGPGLSRTSAAPRTRTDAVTAFTVGSSVEVLSPLADETAAVGFTVAGSGIPLWNKVNRAVQDTIFQGVAADAREGWMVARSVQQGLRLRIYLTPRGTDSTAIVVTGARYTGQSGRPGLTLVAEEHWPTIRAAEPAAERLLREAHRIQAGIERERREEEERVAADVAAGRVPERAVPFLYAPVGPDSIVRVLADGKLGYCRANTVRQDRHLDSLLIVDIVHRPEWCALSPSRSSGMAGNTYILADPRSVAIGDTISICAISGATRRYRFSPFAWYSDPARCPHDPTRRQKAEPNMLIVRRVQ